MSKQDGPSEVRVHRYQEDWRRWHEQHRGTLHQVTSSAKSHEDLDAALTKAKNRATENRDGTAVSDLASVRETVTRL